MAKMKDKAIVGNIGHFDNEIDMAGLKKVKGIEQNKIKPQYDEWTFPDGHSVMILAEGRLLNLGCATGHPSFVMSASFTNQTIAQIELDANRSKYEKKVYMLPKHLDEKVARLHLAQLGVKLTKLTKEQADYIGVPVDGPYKPEHYRPSDPRSEVAESGKPDAGNERRAFPLCVMHQRRAKPRHVRHASPLRRSAGSPRLKRQSLSLRSDLLGR